MAEFSNEKVENLIKNEKERLEASKRHMRNNHLINLGLIDEGKTIRSYLGEVGYDSETSVFDDEKQRYYSVSSKALDVTDEEYNEICKYFPPKGKPNTSFNVGTDYPLSNLTAKLFSVLFEIILWIILIGGIIGGGILGGAMGDFGGVLVGIILGGIASFIIIIFTGGFISLFIKLVNNTDEIRRYQDLTERNRKAPTVA